MLSPQELTKEFEVISQSAPTIEDLMTFIVERLQRHLPNYDWVGFYMVKDAPTPAGEPILELGPFIGEHTPHKTIPLSKGICGAAVTTDQTIIVDDVNSDPRYLSCSLNTKSEIVVPIRVRGSVVGELDIDSHKPAAFNADDRQFCERVTRIVAQYLERAA